MIQKYKIIKDFLYFKSGTILVLNGDGTGYIDSKLPIKDRYVFSPEMLQNKEFFEPVK